MLKLCPSRNWLQKKTERILTKTLTNFVPKLTSEKNPFTLQALFQHPINLRMKLIPHSGLNNNNLFYYGNGPSYANLFVGYIENQFFNQYNGPRPKLYRRYIDDCVGATSSTREELEQFIYSVNSFHPALKYTWQISETSIAFLDINVSIHNNGLSTSVYYRSLQTYRRP